MADNLPLDRGAMKDPSTSYLRIYVGGIPDKTTPDDMYEHFKCYGKIMGIAVNRLFGFVQFEDESSAQAAISKAAGSNFLGKTISVKTAQTNTANTNYRRDTEVVHIKSDIAPAVALTDSVSAHNDEGDDQYDNFGNFIGDKKLASAKMQPAHKRHNSEYDDDYDEGYGWNDDVPGRGVRGGARGARGLRSRGRGRGRGGFRDRSPVGGRGSDWPERGGYDRFSQPEYPRNLPVPERNDCEIIVVSKGLTEYAEYIEGRLKRLGIVVDLLFPMEDVPIGKVLGNIASRGCLYAILVMPQNHENRSLTLTILHGLPQEHRNMPLEDALQLLSRNFQEVQRGGSSGREALCALLGQLADGGTLTVLQYDKVIEYLQERREQQVKLELGEPLTQNKAQADLQQRILTILNDKKTVAVPEPTPVPAPSLPTPQGQNKLLNDPTVKKALDAILLKFT